MSHAEEAASEQEPFVPKIEGDLRGALGEGELRGERGSRDVVWAGLRERVGVAGLGAALRRARSGPGAGAAGSCEQHEHPPPGAVSIAMGARSRVALPSTRAAGAGASVVPDEQYPQTVAQPAFPRSLIEQADASPAAVDAARAISRPRRYRGVAAIAHCLARPGSGRASSSDLIEKSMSGDGRRQGTARPSTRPITPRAC